MVNHRIQLFQGISGTDHRSGVGFDQQDGSAVGGWTEFDRSARAPASLGTL
jgi:hypothetical protein